MYRLAGATHAMLRIVAGLLYMCHGGQKLLGWFGGIPNMSGPLPPLMMMAGAIELVGGALLVIGLATQPVAFITAGEMAVAYFKAHFPNGIWPIENHGELPVLFCFIWLYFAANGAGPFSIDELLWNRRWDPEHAPARVKHA